MEDPTNAVLAEMIKNVAHVISEIKGQTTLTNGRVGVLEKDKDERTGEMRIIKFLMVSIVVPVVLLLIKVYWIK